MIFTLPVIIAILIAILALLLLLQPESLSKTSMEEKIMRNQFKSSKHKWEKSELKTFYFCYLCSKLTNGWFSDILECKKCGIIIHKICKFTKLRKPDCKYIVAKHESSKFYHQWRQCSYSANSSCCICQQNCTGFESYICLWCNRIRHGLCDGDHLQCDFGPLRKFIMEPTEIKCTGVNFTTNAFSSLRKRNKKIKDKTSGSEGESQNDNKITINCHPSKHPVVVLINKKSGGQIGNNFIKAFYQILNPLQVISVLDEGLEKLKLFIGIPNLFLLIAGGDGTVCSVLNYVKTLPQWKDNNPPFAIIPLGTGNDLSRSLGWGGSVEQVHASELLMDTYKRGKVQMLDRWKMTTTSQDESQQFTIYNYLGIGLEAKICKDFHEIRNKYPQLFFSQFSNKLIYTQIGAIDIFKNKGQQLNDIFDLKVDGKVVNIDEFENIIILNIDSWGGGVTGLWKADQEKGFVVDNYGDGLIEVIGLTDVIHMGQVQVGMDQSFFLAQGKKIEMISKIDKKVVPVQIDGEPIEFVTPLNITIQRKDQVNVMATNPSQSGKLVNFLKTGLKEKIISEDQYEKLVSISKKKSLT